MFGLEWGLVKNIVIESAILAYCGSLLALLAADKKVRLSNKVKISIILWLFFLMMAFAWSLGVSK